MPAPQEGPAGDAERWRSALAEERGRALERAAALRRDVDRIVESTSLTATDDEHDPEGTTAFERAQAQSLLDATAVALREIDAALARVEAGTYGRCERCGGPIAPERLEARPIARTCIGCAGRRTP
jgi:DnaK suppressor protein